MGLQQVFHILRQACAVSSVFSHAFPELEKELRRILVHEQDIDLVDEHECLLPLLPVCDDAVQNTVKYHQHTDRPQLLSKLQDVVAYESVFRIHVRLFCKSIERSSRKKFKLQCQRMSFRLRLTKELVSEILQRRRLASVVPLLVEPVHIFRAPVDDGLLPLCKTMSCNDLFAKRLQELRLFYDRIHFSIFFAHIHGVDVIGACCRYLDDFSAKSPYQRRILPFRIHDDDVCIRGKHQVHDLVLSCK